jgi:RNase P/RNase MRP subunit p29
MKRIVSSALVSFVFIVLHAAYCQSGATTPSVSTTDDYAKAEDDYRDIGVGRYHNLHDRPSRSDGTKGYSIVLSNEHNLGHSSSDLEPFLNEQEYAFHGLICSSTAIAVGKLVGSESHLSKNKNTIFTRYHFIAESLIKNGPGVVVGGNVDVIGLGGSVVDEGERLSVILTDTAPYKVDMHYILFLFHDPRASLNVFYSPELVKLNITDGQIEGEGPSYITDVANRESINSLKQRIQTSLAKAAYCTGAPPVLRYCFKSVANSPPSVVMLVW